MNRIFGKTRILLLAFLIGGVFLYHPDPGLQAQSELKGTFQPEFKDVEIRDFLKTMAQITRRNILIDDAIKGKITVVSHRKIPRSKALDFLKQVLEVKGFAVIDENGFLKVVPFDRGKDSSLPEGDATAQDRAGIVSRVLKMPAGVNVNEVANVLRQIAGKNTTVVPYLPSNTIVVTGYATNVRRAEAITGELMSQMTGPSGSTTTSTDSVHIYRAKHITAESLAQVLVRLDNPQIILTEPAKAPNGANGANGQPVQPQPVAVPTGQPAGKIKAVAHKESNSIVVTANPGEWNEILQIIQRLDQLRQQILLEVLIAEVTSSNLNDFGIDWRYQGNDGPAGQFNTGLAAEGGLVDGETGNISGNNTLNGFSLGFLEQNGELLGILNANINNRNFNVLSSPQVLTLDNQEAEINVGQDVPVRTQERNSGGGNAEATVNSFEYRPAGIKLKFTPYVNADDRIGIDLFSEITTIEGGQTAATNPTFNKRNIKTFVNVNNKQTIVIGGLVFTEKLQAVAKVPLLGDIPLIGHLFRRTTHNVRRTNLMLFITPHILSNARAADNITKYKRREQLKAQRERHNEVILWPEEPIETDRDETFEKFDQDLD
ncbi:MAG: type II secretion system protein GspD [bacterium]|nr:type II secretion system protein GspD [bacterium]